MKFSVLFLLPGLATGAVIQLDDTIGGLVPDGSISGIARSLELNVSDQTIESVSVSISVSPAPGSTAFHGDLYFYLTDGINLVTLGNRVGRDLGVPDGFADDLGFNVTFSDMAAADFHEYRAVGSPPLTSVLTGTYQPDGRASSPQVVVTGDARTSQLSDFSGLSADRTFTLFVADLSTGAEHQLDRWSLNVVTVPEPSSVLLTLSGLVAVLQRRMRERRV